MSRGESGHVLGHDHGEAKEGLRSLAKARRNTVLDAIARQLQYEPRRADRNRKQLHANKLAAWELRVGDLRVFYDVADAPDVVTVNAVGWKEHNKLFFRGKEYVL